MTRARATLIGFTAILMWSLLALLTVGSAPVPPFLLTAMCFAIGGVLGLIWIVASGEGRALRTVGWRVYAFGTVALFGYHFLYFSALRMAPAAEAGLIAYLWPLFIVLLSGLLPGETLTRLHIVGALLAFAGAALIVMRGAGGMTPEALPGLGLAFLCAVTWAVYSVLSRRLGDVPTASVAVFCLATAVLSLGAHVLLEETVWPSFGPWLAFGPCPGNRTGRDRVLHMGCRDEKGRYPASGRRILRRASAVDAGLGDRWHRRCIARVDHRGGPDCRGAALAARASAGKVTPG